MPKKIFLASTKYSKEIENLKFITISKKRFFGYEQIGDIVIADKEKAIIDSLLFPKYSGGISEIIKGFNIESLNLEKLIKYAIRVDCKAVLRRLGYILEEKGEKRNLSKIKKLIGKGYELLDPSLPRKNNFNKQWLLDVNL